jgi:hypothetical protein
VKTPRLLRPMLGFCRHLCYRERHQDRWRWPRSPVRATSDRLHVHRRKQGLPRSLHHGGLQIHRHEQSVLKGILSIHGQRQWQLSSMHHVIEHCRFWDRVRLEWQRPTHRRLPPIGECKDRLVWSRLLVLSFGVFTGPCNANLDRVIVGYRMMEVGAT